MSELKEIIRKHVLKNAYDYGSANAGAVAGKVIAEFPDAKNDMKKTMKEIYQIISETSLLSKEQIEKEMSDHTYFVKKNKKKRLELESAKAGAVITRFPPEPSGYPHIGHAKAAFLNYEAARAYGGEFILRFDDTNPEKESSEYVDAFMDGLEWLGIRWDRLSYTSENLESIYEAVDFLIREHLAYVTTAKKQEISESRMNSKPLHEREDSPSENLKKWNAMLSEDFSPGEALLLYKGDFCSNNTVMRDPALARIIDKQHYRQGSKYRVWPSYDLAVVYMDYKEGVTHAMRSKEYELRDELYYSLFDAFGWKRPIMTPFSRLAIKNAPISKRLLGPLVSEGKVHGWDDPRLPTIAGLRCRGILPEAIRNFVLSFGLSKVESEPDWEGLLSENRKLLDAKSPHYFFVQNPVELDIKGCDDMTVTLRLNPKEEMGQRKLHVTSRVYISDIDAKNLTEGELFRLKDLFNVRLISKEESKLLCEYAGDGIVPKKFQWVPSDKLDCIIVKPGDLLRNGEYNPVSLVEISGVCEKNCGNLNIGDIIQFERFGFCRLDRKSPTLQFIFSC